MALSDSTPQEREDEIALRALRMQSSTSLMKEGIRWGGVIGGLYVGVYLPVSALAGDVTVATIAIDFLTSFKVNTTVSVTLAGGGVLYGYRERRLRQRTIARLQGHIRRLERKVNPERTSSNLTPQGRTNPGDEI